MTVTVAGLGPIDPALIRRGLERRAPELACDLRFANTDEEALQAVALVARAQARVDSACLDAHPDVRVVVRTGVGYDLVDVEAAAARGVAVVTTPGANGDAVAEGALAHTLSIVKGLPSQTAIIRAGGWAERNRVPVGDLDGATVAVLGYGRIGRRVGELFSAFRSRVRAYDPATVDFGSGVERVRSIDEAVAGADIVTIHIPENPATRGLVDDRLLSMLADGSYLVNLSRGGIVDLDAVERALDSGKLAGVGLDVFPDEPPAPHPVFERENVVLSAHTMGLSRLAYERTCLMVGEAIADVLSDRVPVGLVTPVREISERREKGTNA